MAKDFFIALMQEKENRLAKEVKEAVEKLDLKKHDPNIKSVVFGFNEEDDWEYWLSYGSFIVSEQELEFSGEENSVYYELWVISEDVGMSGLERLEIKI